MDVAEVNPWRCLEESGQWLGNFDPTHLVLASGKLLLQKILYKEKSSALPMRFELLEMALDTFKCFHHTFVAK